VAVIGIVVAELKLSYWMKEPNSRRAFSRPTLRLSLLDKREWSNQAAASSMVS
jgi:hypothetical protein